MPQMTPGPRQMYHQAGRRNALDPCQGFRRSTPVSRAPVVILQGSRDEVVPEALIQVRPRLI